MQLTVMVRFPRQQFKQPGAALDWLSHWFLLTHKAPDLYKPVKSCLHFPMIAGNHARRAKRTVFGTKHLRRVYECG